MSRKVPLSLSLMSWGRRNYFSLIRKRLTELNRRETDREKKNHLIVYRRQCSIVEERSKQKEWASAIAEATAAAIIVFFSHTQATNRSLEVTSTFNEKKYKRYLRLEKSASFYFYFFSRSLFLQWTWWWTLNTAIGRQVDPHMNDEGWDNIRNTVQVN